MPLPSDDPQQRRPNIELARKILQWEPATALEEGLLRTLVVLTENYKALLNGSDVALRAALLLAQRMTTAP
jgi:UDP-glucuronate decarboxylase